MGMIHRIQDFLGIQFRKSHLKGNIFDTVNRDWRQLDVERVWSVGRFADMAEENGKNNIPETEARSYDGGETAIMSEIKGMIEHLVSSYRADISASDTKIQSLELEKVEDQFDKSVVSYQREVQTIERNLEAHVNPLREHLRFVQAKLRRLQDFYCTDEPPKNYDKSDKGFWVATGVVLLVQALISSFFYSEANPVGLIGGAATALLLSSLDVTLVSVFALIATKSTLRTKKSAFPAIKVFGVFIFLIAIPYMFLINLAFAHTREILSEITVLSGLFPVSMTELSDRMLPINSLTMGLDQLMSFILFVLTLTLSAYQFFQTFNHFDPIPGYKKTYREFANTREELLDLIHMAIDAINKRLEKEQLKVENDLFVNPIKALEGFARHKKIAVENCQSCVKHLVPIGIALIERYRDVNKKHRTTPPPSHFDIPWSYNPPELPVDGYERDMAIVERYKSQSQSLLTRQRDCLDNLDRIRTSRVKYLTKHLRQLISLD